MVFCKAATDTHSATFYRVNKKNNGWYYLSKSDFSWLQVNDSLTYGDGYGIYGGSYNHLEGTYGRIIGNVNHVEGMGCKAYGTTGHAEGSGTTVNGANCHVEGYQTASTASANAAHAEGANTLVTSRACHAEGDTTEARGQGSHTEGNHTITYSDYQHVQGQYNVRDDDSVYAHIVGNGSSGLPSNAHTLDWSGNAWYAGDVYVGSTSGTNKDAGSKKLATEEYVTTAISTLPEPMIFKGSLGTGGTITTLPAASSSNKGYTYKVITDGTYAGQSAEVGDTFISDGFNWVLIPSGDEPSGTVTSVAITTASGGPISIDDSTAITSSGTRTLSHNTSGVTAGDYTKVTVDTYGHVTSGSNPTTLSGYGITDAETTTNKVTSISSSSTNTEYPSAAAVYNFAKTNYSSAEQVIGTWIDGKPLYRRVMTGTVGSTATDGQYASVQADIADNIDFAYISLQIEERTDNIVVNWPRHYIDFQSGIQTISNCSINSQKKLNVSNSIRELNAGTYYVWVEYTKTTDIAPV